MNNNNNSHAVNTGSAKLELLASHIEMFRQAFGVYLEKYRSVVAAEMKNAETGKVPQEFAQADKTCGELSRLLFEGLLCNYYRTVISGLKKLAAYDKKYMPSLIETYEELWKSAPKLKDVDYLSPYLLDLCKFLYEVKETGALTFFYNLFIYCREIPFLSAVEEENENMPEEDLFAEFKKARNERLFAEFDEEIFNKTYGRFFLILSGWRERTEGYYTKDEIFFMNGLFIMDELADCFNGALPDKENKNKIFRRANKSENKNPGEEKLDYAAAEEVEKHESGICAGSGTGTGGGTVKNTYIYIYGDEIKEKILRSYEKALRYFKRAIEYNPNNPRYYYEYARCLKNSGKSDEAEIFFKKAFDLNS
jgi:tetratricopeptide (TPR) repeat protein